VIGFVKMLCALVEHSSEWIVARIHEPDVQAFLGLILRITGWDGIGGVDENVSEVSVANEALSGHGADSSLRWRCIPCCRRR
jgi:hypothetical protein